MDLASPGAVAFEVPPLTGSGPVSVSTLDGIAEGPDLAVVPDPYTPYQVVRAVRLDPGSSGDVTVPTGRIAVVLSDVGLGRHLVLTSTSGLGTVQPQVYDGCGTLQALAVGPGAQWTSGALPTDGTVTTILDNSFGAADATFDLSVGVTDDVALTAVIDGPVVPLTLDQPGQVGRISFDGRGGESITVTIPAPTGNAQVQVKDPLGSVIATNAVNAAPASVALIATGVGLTVDGRYTVIVASFPGGAGDFPVQVASATPPQSLSLSADGTRLDVPIASVDAKALVTADATAGQRLAFRLEVPDGSGCLQFRSVDAAGVELLAGGMCGGQAQFLDPVTVTADGPVVTTVEGQGGGTGTLGLQSWSVTDLDQSVTLDGIPVTLPLETPGQAATLRFDGRAGDVLHLSGTNPAGPNVATLLRGPDGSLLATVTLGDPDVATDLPPLPADGPYTLTIDPFGEAVGTLELSITAAQGSGLGHSGMGFLSGLAAKTPDTEAGSDAGVTSEAVAGCPASADPVDATTALPVRWHPDDTERWVPGSDALTGSWVTGRAASPWERVPLAVAPAGVTALSGRVLRLDGMPLADVRISVGDRATCTDPSGRFLLTDVPDGIQEVLLDGSTAGRTGHRYGTFEIGAVVREHLTTDLNATVWMPLLDTEHAITVASDSRRQVLSSPLVPGLSIIVPRGARLVDEDGHPVRQLTISPVPVDRPPFPTPAMGPRFPTYFTVQPAGIRVVGGEARVIYPNPTGRPPGTQAQFWSYEADEGWESYGTGTVTRDGRSIIPVAGLRELVPAALYAYPGLPATGPIDGQEDSGHPGEPVDLATGLYWYDATDLVLGDRDGLRVTRTYRTNDTTVRLFGVGSNPWWALTLASTSKDEYADLLMPNGTPIRFDAVMSPFGQYWEARSTPGELLGARLRFADASDPVEAGHTFVLNLRDGRRLLFTHSTLTGIVELDGRTTQLHSLLGHGGRPHGSRPFQRWPLDQVLLRRGIPTRGDHASDRRPWSNGDLPI